MNAVMALAGAIEVRQAERMDAGERAMTEMWVSRDVWEALSIDAASQPWLQKFGPVNSLEINGVAIRVMGP